MLHANTLQGVGRRLEAGPRHAEEAILWEARPEELTSLPGTHSLDFIHSFSISIHPNDSQLGTAVILCATMQYLAA